jgi:RNA polymerase sigma-70 factor (ECF subfamily)
MKRLRNSPASLAISAAAPGLDQAEARRTDNGERELNLARAAQGGDAEAFRELYDAYRDRIWTLVVYWIGDTLQAQDVHQTVFLKVFRSLRSFRFRSSLFTWIYRIARNECLNYLRGRGDPPVPLEAILGSSDEMDRRPVSNGHEAGQLILQNAVRHLPLKMREVVVLKYLEGLSYEEMSRVLGCAPGTVASRLNRALEDLEERLRPFRPIFMKTPEGKESRR